MTLLPATCSARPTIPAVAEKEVLDMTRKTYAGPLVIGEDLMAFRLERDQVVQLPPHALITSPRAACHRARSSASTDLHQACVAARRGGVDAQRAFVSPRNGTLVRVVAFGPEGGHTA